MNIPLGAVFCSSEAMEINQQIIIKAYVKMAWFRQVIEDEYLVYMATKLMGIIAIKVQASSAMLDLHAPYNVTLQTFPHTFKVQEWLPLKLTEMKLNRMGWIPSKFK